MSALIKKVIFPAFPEIVDNLLSTDAIKVLSAKQGSVLNGKTQQATQVNVGVSRAASQAEVNTGSVSTEFISPATAKLSPWAEKAAVLFDVNGTITKAFNVSSVTKNAGGDFTINMTNDIGSEPILTGTVKCASGTSTAVLGAATGGVFSSTAVQVHTFVNTATPVLINPERVCVVIY